MKGEFASIVDSPFADSFIVILMSFSPSYKDL